MPLNKEGFIKSSQYQKEKKQTLLDKGELEKYQEYLDTNGVYAYGFTHESDQELAFEHIHDLNNSVTVEFWYSNIYRFVILITKPFDNVQLEADLKAKNVAFQEVPVFPFGELTEAEIIQLQAGIVWASYAFIDIHDTIKTLRAHESNRNSNDE